VSVRARVAQFIVNEGHRVDTTLVGDNDELAELVFRTRGQTFSVAVSELEPQRFSFSTAYEVPEEVRDRAQPREALDDVHGDFPETRFTLAHDDTIFIATIQYDAIDVETLLQNFWGIIGRLRDSGNVAVARMVDRSESKAAADKFIRQFMKGERS
jgi:hypothetical protein